MVQRLWSGTLASIPRTEGVDVHQRAWAGALRANDRAQCGLGALFWTIGRTGTYCGADGSRRHG